MMRNYLFIGLLFLCSCVQSLASVVGGEEAPPEDQILADAFNKFATELGGRPLDFHKVYMVDAEEFRKSCQACVPGDEDPECEVIASGCYRWEDSSAYIWDGFYTGAYKEVRPSQDLENVRRILICHEVMHHAAFWEDRGHGAWWTFLNNQICRCDAAHLIYDEGVDHVKETYCGKEENPFGDFGPHKVLVPLP